MESGEGRRGGDDVVVRALCIHTFAAIEIRIACHLRGIRPVEGSAQRISGIIDDTGITDRRELRRLVLFAVDRDRDIAALRHFGYVRIRIGLSRDLDRGSRNDGRFFRIQDKIVLSACFRRLLDHVRLAGVCLIRFPSGFVGAFGHTCFAVLFFISLISRLRCDLFRGRFRFGLSSRFLLRCALLLRRFRSGFRSRFFFSLRSRFLHGLLLHRLGSFRSAFLRGICRRLSDCSFFRLFCRKNGKPGRAERHRERKGHGKPFL